MLPGFRLIAVSFLGGFVLMFFGLRMVASLNNIHEGLPLMAAQAAAASQPGIKEPNGARTAMPVLYDLRFVGSPNAPMLVNVAPEAIERLLPSASPTPPTATAPTPADVAKEATPEVPAEPKTDVEPEASATPVSEPIASVPPPPVQPAPEVVAAIAPQITPAPEPPPAAVQPPLLIEPPLVPEPPLVLGPPVDESVVEPQAALELTPVTEPSAPVEAAPEPVATIAVLSPEPAAPPVVSTPKPTHAKAPRRAAVKVVRKKRARVARRAAPNSQFGSQFGEPPGKSLTAR